MSARSRVLRFSVTRVGSLWRVEETSRGGVGGLFVSLEAAARFVRTASPADDVAIVMTVR